MLPLSTSQFMHQKWSNEPIFFFSSNLATNDGRIMFRIEIITHFMPHSSRLLLSIIQQKASWTHFVRAFASILFSLAIYATSNERNKNVNKKKLFFDPKEPPMRGNIVAKFNIWVNTSGVDEKGERKRMHNAIEVHNSMKNKKEE